jgi:hypothetical protein
MINFLKFLIEFLCALLYWSFASLTWNTAYEASIVRVTYLPY